MKIGIIGSMQFTEKMLEVRDELIKLGHDAFVTDLHRALVGKTDEEKEKINCIKNTIWTRYESFGEPCRVLMLFLF